LKKNKNGKYEISIEFTQMVPFLENSTNNEKKKELSIKASKKGGQKNLDLLQKILKLRKDNAKLLGYKNHAEYVLEDRMAKTPAIVEKFEEDLVKKLRKKGEKELKELVDFKNKIEGTKNKDIEFYNFAYYAKKFEMEKFFFDEEKLREYFELEKVRNGMFDIFGNLFGIEFKKKKQRL
jgi:Zn-dependent oligopeptidase